jgi:hypothetical protein
MAINPNARGANIPMEEGALANRLPAAGGALDARMPQNQQELNQALQAAGNLDANLSQREQLMGQETPSALDVLTSPEGLIKLGLAAAGLLSGNENLQAAGLGIGLGTIEGASATADDIFAQQQKRIADMTGMIEKQQQQLTTLLQSQPNLFVDEEGEDVIAPDQWRRLLGTSVKVSPAAMLKNYRMDKLQQNQLTQYSNMLDRSIEAGNEAGAMQAATGIRDLLGLDITTEALGGMLVSKDYMSAMNAIAHQVDTSSWLDTMLNVAKNGGSPFDAQNCVLKPKAVTISQLDDAVEMQAAEGFKIVAREWAALSEMEKKEWVAKDAGEYIRFVLGSQLPDTNPVILESTLTKLTSMRTKDRVDEIMLDHIMDAVFKWADLQTLGPMMQVDPQTGAVQLNAAIGSLAASGRQVAQLGEGQRYLMSFRAMSPEERAAAVQRLANENQALIDQENARAAEVQAQQKAANDAKIAEREAAAAAERERRANVGPSPYPALPEGNEAASPPTTKQTTPSAPRTRLPIQRMTDTEELF